MAFTTGGWLRREAEVERDKIVIFDIISRLKGETKEREREKREKKKRANDKLLLCFCIH